MKSANKSPSLPLESQLPDPAWPHPPHPSLQSVSFYAPYISSQSSLGVSSHQLKPINHPLATAMTYGPSETVSVPSSSYCSYCCQLDHPSVSPCGHPVGLSLWLCCPVTSLMLSPPWDRSTAETSVTAPFNDLRVCSPVGSSLSVKLLMGSCCLFQKGPPYVANLQSTSASPFPPPEQSCLRY